MWRMSIVSKQPAGTSPDALIADASTLRATMDAWPAGAPIALDTEFVRERTYYPRLCLIQLASENQLALVDPLAIEDPGPLLALLCDPARTKLLHAARQDIEVLLPLTRVPPAPVFDTQLAAALIGFPAQVGYGELVRQLLGIELSKDHARTDWARRPLSPEQLAYAADDVRYLPALAALLEDRLAAAGRRGWMEEDSAAFTDLALYRVEPTQAWRRLKGLERLDPAEQGAIRALAQWREERAMERDLPRGWVLPDAALFEIARVRPRTREALSRLASVPRGAAMRAADEILAVVAGQAGIEEAAVVDTRVRPGPDQLRQLKALQARLIGIAAELGIQPEVLATRRDLTALLRGERDVAVLSGWRRVTVGELLLAAL
jgi:ribonuclease D